ncbi:MAG: ABC transporter permease subunit [Victivallales bacterium]|nr:ABC transporter permease subunit [Victivallales bacterium]
MFRFNPITLKRFRRFRSQRRAWYSFLCLVGMYGISLFSELLCNSSPLLVRHEGRFYFPVFRYYPETTFTGSGLQTRTDYRALKKQEPFASGKSWMLWPLLPTGPNEIIQEDSLREHLRVICRLVPIPQVAGISVDQSLALKRFQGPPEMQPANWKTAVLPDFWHIPKDLQVAIAARFANQTAPRMEVLCAGNDGRPDVLCTLPEYTARATAPRQVRLTLRLADSTSQSREWLFHPHKRETPLRNADAFASLPDDIRRTLSEAVTHCFADSSPRTENLSLDGKPYSFSVEREAVRYPFRPVPGHWCGIDDAGRDVLARLLYALRTSLTFGLILVFCSLTVGTIIGFVQGYYAGWVDLTGQRLIEIWSALPFLYVIILLGSIYGPGFWLMLFCYALFNWIGISYYMRAQMLQLRKQPFVEAAMCLGLPTWRLVLRHILPNGLVPLITFFPFSLVGVIGSLAMLDYLGFGLPPPTPSIGQLLQQAQSQRWAWWLILYPSLLLFCMMLLGVFIGEGVRDAFDPRQQGHLE